MLTSFSFFARFRFVCDLLLTAKPWKERQDVSGCAAERKRRKDRHTHNPRPNCQLHRKWTTLKFTIDAHSRNPVRDKRRDCNRGGD